MKTIEEYQNKGDIPKSYPNTCYCGCQYYINSNFTEVKCLNPQCYITISQKLLYVINLLNIKNKGEKWAETKTKLMQMNNTNVHHINVLVNSVQDINLKDYPINLSTYLELWCIRRLGTNTSKSITAGCIDLLDFFNKLTKNYLSLSLNISVHSDTIYHLYNELITLKDDMIYYSDYFQILQNNSKSINICITNEIPGFKPRDTFATYISQKYSIDVNVYTSITKKIDYLVCDNRTGTSKETKAIKYGIPIVTHIEMEEILKNG